MGTDINRQNSFTKFLGSVSKIDMSICNNALVDTEVVEERLHVDSHV